MRKRFVLIDIVLLFVISCSIIAQPRISLDSLTLDNAISIALEHHPSLRSANANLRAASASALQSMSAYFPTIGTSAVASRSEGWSILSPAIPPVKRSYDMYTAGIQVAQMIFDFGRTINKVSASNRLTDASEADALAVRGNVILNVQIAYYGVIQSKQVVKVNEEAIDRATQHLMQAKAFYSVGTRAQFDVTRAEVDLANANVNAIRARNQFRLAKLQLENAMGVHADSSYRISEVFEVEQFSYTLDSVKTVAMDQRPELIAGQARVSANRSLVSAAWDQHLPTLSASGSYTWTNYNFPLYSKWNAGVTLSIPIFQGMGISAQVEQAQATDDATQANFELLKESVTLEIEQDYLSVKEAEERIGAAEKLVEQSDQALTLAEKQYIAGIGSTIEVTDAQLTLSNARITKIQALYDYNCNLVRLKRAMGITR
jgi:outer membrane protein